MIECLTQQAVAHQPDLWSHGTALSQTLLQVFAMSNLIAPEGRPVVKTIAGKNVLYVMATKAEYLAQLQASITPLICQVGPVEAALHLTHWLTAHGPVDYVVSLGSAGSKKLEQTSIHQVSYLSYRDMDASAFGFEKGTTPFLDLPAVVATPVKIPNIPQASLSTGANVVAGDGFDDLAADMVDMESWAIMRCCQFHSTHHAPCHFIGLRGISDGAEPAQGYADWAQYLDIIDANLAHAVSQFETALANNMLSPN